MKRVIFSLTAAASLFALVSCATTGGTAKTAAADNSVPAINNPDPTGTVDLLDGFEEGMYWTPSGWDNDAGFDADTTDEWASEGSYSGYFEFNAADPDAGATGGDKASFGCKSLLINDFTPYSAIYMDINNTTNEGIDLAFVVQDTNWAWCQANPQTLGPGVNKNVVIDLKALNIPDASAVQYLYMCLFQKVEGQILVDNIRLVK